MLWRWLLLFFKPSPQERHVHLNPQESRESRSTVREAVAHCVMHCTLFLVYPKSFGHDVKRERLPPRPHTCLPRELPLARGTVSHFPIVSKTRQLSSPVTKTVHGLKMKSGGPLLPTLGCASPLAARWTRSWHEAAHPARGRRGTGPENAAEEGLNECHITLTWAAQHSCPPPMRFSATSSRSGWGCPSTRRTPARSPWPPGRNRRHLGRAPPQTAPCMPPGCGSATG